jgi:mRNA-degrading endonuclease toxin of MazEF toxin-antitoxin module
MAVSRGEIVEVSFPLPGGNKNHPTLVISNNKVFADEGCFIGVMLSGSPTIDDYTFELENEMFSKIPKKRTQVRCHLIALISENEIVSRHGTLIRACVNQIAEKICAEILN